MWLKRKAGPRSFHKGVRLIASFLNTQFSIELRLISIARLILTLCETGAQEYVKDNQKNYVEMIGYSILRLYFEYYNLMNWTGQSILHGKSPLRLQPVGLLSILSNNTTKV